MNNGVTAPGNLRNSFVILTNNGCVTIKFVLATQNWPQNHLIGPKSWVEIHSTVKHGSNLKKMRVRQIKNSRAAAIVLKNLINFGCNMKAVSP